MALARRDRLEELRRAEQHQSKASLRRAVLHMSSHHDGALSRTCFRSWCDGVALARHDRLEALHLADSVRRCSVLAAYNYAHVQLMTLLFAASAFVAGRTLQYCRT